MTVISMLISYLEGPFSKSTISIVFDLKSQSRIEIVTAIYCVYEVSPKSVLLQIGTSRARLEKRMTQYAQSFRECECECESCLRPMEGRIACG